MNAPALRPLSTGEILDVAFSLYRRHFATLATVALVSQAVSILVSIYVEASGGMLTNLTLALFSIVLSSVCAAIGMGASTKIIADSYLGRSTAVGEALRWVVPHLARLIVLTVIVSMLVGIGLVLLIFPGVILASGLAVSACVLVVEGLSPTDAMNRSWTLTAGHRLRVFVTVLVAMLLIYVMSIAAVFIGGILAGLLGMASMAAIIVIGAVSAILSILIYPYIYATVTVLYYDLRVRKEGLDLDLMESQLAGP